MILIIIILIVQSRTRVARHFFQTRCKWSNRGCKSTIPENVSSLSLSVSSPVKRERSWVWSRISRIARFVTSIQGPKACCATLRRLPSFFFFFFFSRGITVRVFSPPTGHRHGPSGVSIDRARPKLSPNRLDPMRSKLIVPA